MEAQTNNSQINQAILDLLGKRVRTLFEFLRTQKQIKAELSSVKTALKKATSPRFEIVFAGAFSAGKSMLINAVLGQELLYSSEGHATGTECYIEYANETEERVELTFLTRQEILEEAQALGNHINVKNFSLEQDEIPKTIQKCEGVINQEGGVSKSERAKKANALKLLLQGFQENQKYIREAEHFTISMEQLGQDFEQAAQYARRGKNSAVLKRINYYCKHDILRDGNTLVDLPGIDAPVERDAELTYRKIEDPETSAVICVLKVADAGEMTVEETRLLETIRANEGISDRVFYVFNRIDETWYNTGKYQRLQELLLSDFYDAQKRGRVFQTSALLGFYGSQIRETQILNRFGLDSIFKEQVRVNEVPQFVHEFNRYCFSSSKLNNTEFDIPTSTRESPTDRYVNALARYPHPRLIDQLIQDSGIEDFRNTLDRYLLEEKRPELLRNLAQSLQGLCYQIHDYLSDRFRQLAQFPDDPKVLKEHKLAKISQELQQAADQFHKHIGQEIQKVIEGTSAFENAFVKLEAKMSGTLLELLSRFSYWDAYESARKIHPNYVKAPLLTILGEAFYYLASELEQVLVEEVKGLTLNFFDSLISDVRQQDYYRQLTRLLGNNHPTINLIAEFREVEKQVIRSLIDQAHSECELYVQEDPKIYSTNQPGIYQFQEALQQVFQVSLSRKSLEGIEPTIQQLLEIDFKNKVSKTTQETFRYRVSSTLNQYLRRMIEEQHALIIQQDDYAREHARNAIDLEIDQALMQYHQDIQKIQKETEKYNCIVEAINLSLIELGLESFLLSPVVPTNLNV